jgi:hypothetical protein
MKALPFLICIGMLAWGDAVTDFWASYRSLLNEGTLTTTWEGSGEVFLAGSFQYRRLRYDSRLETWLSTMSNQLEGAQVPRDREGALAFWVNAHNYGCLAEMLGRPQKGLDEGVDPARRFMVIAGRIWSLYEIEKRAIRPLGEPRVLFALHQGAVSGARMPREILHPSTLAVVLSQLARESLKSPLFSRPNAEGTRCRVSGSFAYFADENALSVPWVMSNVVMPYLTAGAPTLSLSPDLPFDGRLNTPEAVHGRLEALAMEEVHLHVRRLPPGDSRNALPLSR